jgi:apolipoprotein N-acyltransferase
VPWLKYPAWVAAATYLAVFPALASWLAAALWRRSGWSLAVTFPPAYLMVEELRASGEMGFPWFQPGYALHSYPPLIQMASLGSVTLLTVWVLVVNVLLWRAAGPAPPGARPPSRGLAAAGVACAVLLPALWGNRVLAVADAAARSRPAGAAVGLVQADIAGEIKWSGLHQREILERFLSLSDSAAAETPHPVLVIWPETATGSYLRLQVDQAIEVARFAARAGVPVFSGYPDYGLDSLGVRRYWNAAGMFRADGTRGATYAKRHLVPFGERMPFQRWIPALGKIELGQAEWTAGGNTVLFDSPQGPFSCLVCFEAIFPDLARADVRRGARWLVNITNDEWFGRSVALDQHAGMALLRAVENHVPLARCANTGITLLADSYGRVRARLPVFEPGVLVAALGSPGPATPFTRVGDWPGWLATLVVAALALRARGPVR